MNFAELPDILIQIRTAEHTVLAFFNVRDDAWLDMQDSKHKLSWSQINIKIKNNLRHANKQIKQAYAGGSFAQYNRRASCRRPVNDRICHGRNIGFSIPRNRPCKLLLGKRGRQQKQRLLLRVKVPHSCDAVQHRPERRADTYSVYSNRCWHLLHRCGYGQTSGQKQYRHKTKRAR